MTKLKHSRPYLKYLDNLRRELQRDARRTDTLSFGTAATTSSALAQLDSSDAKHLLELLDALNEYLIAQHDTLCALAKKINSKRHTFSAARAKQKLAEEALLRVATKVAAIAFLGEMHGKGQMLKAYFDLAENMREVDESLWDTLHNFAMRTAIERLNNAIDSMSFSSEDS